jgi:hypothetical protein
MVRRPSKCIDAALVGLSQWVDDAERRLEAMRVEVEALRAERIELIAQVQFAVAQANRETIAAAELQADLLAQTRAPKLRAVRTDETEVIRTARAM